MLLQAGSALNVVVIFKSFCNVIFAIFSSATAFKNYQNAPNFFQTSPQFSKYLMNYSEDQNAILLPSLT